MTSGRDALSAPFHAVAISGRPCRGPVTVSVSIHWKNWSPSGVPLAAYRQTGKHHEKIIPFTDAERVAGADTGTVLIYPQSVVVNFVAAGRFWRRLSVWLPVVSACMPLVCAGTLRARAAARISGCADCHGAVFAAGDVVQTGGGSGGDGGDVYLAGRCRVDFTALIYLVASLFFRLMQTACRQRLEGRELCQS